MFVPLYRRTVFSDLFVTAGDGDSPPPVLARVALAARGALAPGFTPPDIQADVFQAV